ncbi:hypothetical protein SETIT_5G239300v2 [Setaria italica]|uniref:Uncharacterized protein n=1 Tax=Setaria italica TaxID=4555 RepID=K3XPY5_SETIT|nr:myb-related protein 340 [Setaria italica]RCV26357.1 hypothetical protein SETIT_5G239300v2 [Setaria italica]
MGRTMCGCAGEPAVRKGPWTLEEDLVLVGYISQHGEGSWDNLARAAGLNRNGKSCRLRWLNYLRPGVRRGSITPAEDAVIRELHATLGNKWSKIAAHLPGRTDNEIKNYWRTRIQKRPAAPANTQQQPCRAPAAAPTTATAASEGASSSSSASASHGSSAAEDYYYWCMKPNNPDQQACYSHKTVAAAAAVGLGGWSASAALTRQDSSSTSTTAGDGCKLTGYSYPYYSELGSIADGVMMVDADNFWNVVDNFWGTLPFPDATF